MLRMAIAAFAVVAWYAAVVALMVLSRGWAW